MICPKCGFTQQDRADCIKCGVVFAKYFAFRSPDSAPAHLSQEPPPVAGSASAEPIASDTTLLQEIRQGLRSLQERFHELEFERAERRRLHSEMRALDERLKEGLVQISACREIAELNAAKLGELPPAPTLQDFAALKTEFHAIDLQSVHKRMEKIENRLDSFLQEMDVWARQLESLPVLSRRLEDIESRLERLTEARECVSAQESSDRLESVTKSFEELKSSVQNVTLRYSEIGDLKKNHLIMKNEVESLRHATENLKREFTNGTAARIAQLDMEVSALKAEARKVYERMELLDSTTGRPQLPSDSIAPDEVAELREDMAAARRRFEEERQQTQSKLCLLETTLKESLAAAAELPEQIGTFAAQLHFLNQQYHTIADTLAQLSNATHGIPERTIELGRDVAQLGEECLQTRMQVQAIEDRIAGKEVRSFDEPINPGSGDMHVIRENLDEIRRFMATLSRKI